jgi:hypothetical protein
MKKSVKASFSAVVLAVATLAAELVAQTPPASSSADTKDKSIGEARVALYVRNGTNTVELRLTDTLLIKRIFEEPLSKATPDVNPKSYVLVGSLILKRKDGSEEAAALFHPLGKVKIRDKYVNVDLSEFRKVVKDAIAEANESVQRW